MTVSKGEIYDFSAEKRHETAAAVLIFDGEKEVWLPKSHLEDYGDGTFAVPQWLAEKKGLV